MDETKLYVCLEAKQAQGEGQQQKHVYLICSLTFNDLASTLTDPPTLTTEAFFEGYPSMGCGFYDSKIVFAGGQLPQEEETDLENEDIFEQSNNYGSQVQLEQETDLVYEDIVDQSNHDGPQVQLVEGTNSENEDIVDQSNHNGLMIFDLNSRRLSSDSFPSMLRGKLKPLVFQLHDKLYVMDTVSGYRDGSFEYFYPINGEWNLLRQPSYDAYKDELDCQRDRNYPCLVFGNAVHLSVSIDDDNFIFIHHPNLTYKSWFPAHVLRPGNPLLFSGVATFCHHGDANDFLIISFSNRVVRVHLFDLTGHSLPASKDLFSLPSSSEFVEDEQVSGYFADFGDGIFSLTASDSARIYVFTFQILGPDDPMMFQLLSHYEYRFDALSFGVDIISVVGCFAPYQNFSAIKHAEKALQKRYSKLAQRSEDVPDTFEFCGVKIEVLEGSPGSLVPVSVDTAMALDPVGVFCILSQ